MKPWDRRTAVASCSALPEPMLARSGRLPTSGDYADDVKWDGFRAIVSTEGELRVRLCMRIEDWEKSQHPEEQPEPTEEQLANSAKSTEAMSVR